MSLNPKFQWLVKSLLNGLINIEQKIKQLTQLDIDSLELIPNLNRLKNLKQLDKILILGSESDTLINFETNS